MILIFCFCDIFHHYFWINVLQFNFEEKVICKVLWSCEVSHFLVDWAHPREAHRKLPSFLGHRSTRCQIQTFFKRKTKNDWACPNCLSPSVADQKRFTNLKKSPSTSITTLPRMWTNKELMSSEFYFDAHDLSFQHKIYVTASLCWNYRKPNKNLYWSGPSAKFLFSLHLWNLITKRLFPRVRSTNQMFEVLEITKTDSPTLHELGWCKHTGCFLYAQASLASSSQWVSDPPFTDFQIINDNQW